MSFLLRRIMHAYYFSKVVPGWLKGSFDPFSFIFFLLNSRIEMCIYSYVKFGRRQRRQQSEGVVLLMKSRRVQFFRLSILFLILTFFKLNYFWSDSQGRKYNSYIRLTLFVSIYCKHVE